MITLIMLIDKWKVELCLVVFELKGKVSTYIINAK